MRTEDDYLNSVTELLKEARKSCTRMAVEPDTDHALLCTVDEKLRVSLLLLAQLREARRPSVGSVASSSFSGRLKEGY